MRRTTMRLLRGGLIASAVAVTLVAAAALGSGGSAVGSVAAGGALSVAFFAGGIGAVAALLSWTTAFAMVGAVGWFGVQAFGLLIVYDLLASASWLDRGWFAGGVVAGVLAWQVGMVLVMLRGRHLVYDDPPGAAERPSTDAPHEGDKIT